MRLFIPIFAVFCALALTACHDDDDDFDHTPAPGMGAMIVVNDTSDDMSVFIDGAPAAEVREGKDRAYDLPPGVHRVILDQQGGDHNFRGDVDILEGQLTVFRTWSYLPEVARGTTYSYSSTERLRIDPASADH